MKSSLLITMLLVTLLAAGTNGQDADSATVFVVPVSGTVNSAMAAFIGRAVAESREHQNSVLVLELDTYGGEVDAAFRIVDTMLTVNRPTFAYVKTKAISAGALIALSCRTLYMEKHTTLGDVAPLIMSEGGPKMLGEKFQSPIRAKFRILAKQNGYPQRLTEAMVTAGMAVYEVRFPDTVLYLDSTELADLSPQRRAAITRQRTVVRSGELLTVDDKEAAELGFSRKTVESLEKMLAENGYGSAEVIRYRENWSEVLVRVIGFLAPVLMMLGMALLYIEFKNPGLIVPGVVGALFLALVFFGQYMVGLADYTYILLAIAGVVLIAVEIFLFPSSGIIIGLGMILLIASLVFSLQGFVLPKPEFPWQRQMLEQSLLKVLGAFAAAGVISFLAIRYGLSGMSRVIHGPYLEDRIGHEDSGVSIPLREGDIGTSVTPLRTAGRALFAGEEYDVVTDGEYIDKGTGIRVIQKQGNRIVVGRERSS